MFVCRLMQKRLSKDYSRMVPRQSFGIVNTATIKCPAKSHSNLIFHYQRRKLKTGKTQSSDDWPKMERKAFHRTHFFHHKLYTNEPQFMSQESKK